MHALKWTLQFSVENMDLHVKQVLAFRKVGDLLASVVPMIDYNRKSLIYMQPIIDRLDFWESIIIGKILKQTKYSKCKVLFNYSY